MGICITSVGSYVPSKRLTNADLERMVDTTDEWIVTRTGIHERRISSLEQASTDLMVPACHRALENARKTIDDIDLLIVTWSFPDRLVELPSDILASKLGARPGLLAIDSIAECAGFCWALADAAEKMTLGNFKTVLVVSGDATSKFVDYQDRNTCVLFGDGAGAVVLEKSDDIGIIGYKRECDRRYQDCIRVEAGGTAMPASHETIEKRLHYMHFGPAGGGPMLRAIVERLPDLCRELCREYGIDINQLTKIIPHQLNRRIIDSVRKVLKKYGVREEAIFDENTTIYGNCSGSSLPVALDTVYRRGDLEPGDLVQLISAGAGIKYGVVLLRWTMERYR